MTNQTAKDRILLAAGPVFACKGFRSATVREICEAADVNVASINYHFGDKRALYLQTLILAREMREQQVPFPVWPDNITPADKLHGFIKVLLNRLVAMKTEPWQVRLLLREVIEPTEASRHLVEEYFRPFLDHLLEIVDEIVGQRLPDHKRFQIGLSIIGQCMHYRVTAEMISMMIPSNEYREHFDIGHLADHIWTFSMGGLNQIQNPLQPPVPNEQTSSQSSDEPTLALPQGEHLS